jgi:hypothetical protein
MKEYTREHGDAELAADLAYVRLKSGERPFKPYGEVLALPGAVIKVVPSRKIPANEGAAPNRVEQMPMPPLGQNIVRLSDARSQGKTTR